MSVKNIARVLFALALLHAAAHMGQHIGYGCNGWALLSCPAHESRWAWKP